jgi:hypothetical protein
LQQHERTFQDLDTHIAVVTFETAARARAYASETRIAWPVLLDRDRTLYRGYGMQRGRLLDILGAATWWAYAKELARGQLPGWPTDDTRQLGGDVLIDPTGIVKFHHVGSGPADRPSVDTILGARQRSD